MMISVIVPMYNCAEFLAEAVASIRAQGVSSLEIIAIDDCSTDNTLQVAKALEGKDLKLLTRPVNGGIAAARNTGIREAQGQWLAFLDADDLWVQGALALFLSQVQEALSASQQAWGFGEVSHFAHNEAIAKKLVIPETTKGFFAGNMLVQREAFLRVGLFQEELRVGEFVDWFSRARSVLGEPYRFSKPTLRRRVHASNTSRLQANPAAAADYLKAIRHAIEEKKRAAHAPLNVAALEQLYAKAAGQDPGHYKSFEIFAKLCITKKQWVFADDALHEAMFRLPSDQAEKLAELSKLRSQIAPMVAAQGPARSRGLTDFQGLISLSAFCPRMDEGRGLPTDQELRLARVSLIQDAERCRKAFEEFIGWNDDKGVAQERSLQILHALSASEVRMLPLVAKTLGPLMQGLTSDAGPTTQTTPPAYWPLLMGVWKKSFLENSRHFAALKSVVTLFDSHGIDCCVMKGIDHAVRFYGGLAFRPMNDIDLLIHPSRVNQAHQVLVNAGWSTSEVPTSARQRFYYASSYRHFDGSAIDLHWRACEDLVREDSLHEDLGQWQAFEQGGVRWRGLGITQALFTTILHGLYWNHLSPVRWVVDAALVLRGHGHQVDWPELRRLALKYDVANVVDFGLGFLVHHGLAQLPPGVGPGSLSPIAQDVQIRLNPDHQKASVQDVALQIRRWQSKFPSFGLRQFVVAGGADPAAQRQACQAMGVGYSPACSRQAVRQACPEQANEFEFLLVIDADTARTVRLFL